MSGEKLGFQTPLNSAKCVRYLNRVLVLLPTEQEKHDGSHISIVYFCVLALSVLGSLPEAALIAQYLDGLWLGNGYKTSTSYLNSPEMASLSATYFALAIKRMLGLELPSKDERQKIMRFVEQCLCSNGEFRATALKSSERSLRHTYSAHAIAQLLQCQPVWLEKSAKFVLSCQGYEGGFGDSGGQESHAGLTFCALASLKIAQYENQIHPRIINYLAKRQTPEGGHNGRPNKLSDICYSFWVGAALKILQLEASAESTAAAKSFILGSGADKLLGGFIKSPGSDADPYHTALGLCALSMMGLPELRKLDPVLVYSFSN